MFYEAVLFLLKSLAKKLRRAKATISAEAFSEAGQRLKIPLKNEDLLIASKVRSIRFSNFRSLTPKKVHRAVLAPHFWRQKVAKTNV